MSCIVPIYIYNNVSFNILNSIRNMEFTDLAFSIMYEFGF